MSGAGATPPREHWTERIVEAKPPLRRYLGEDEDGTLFVPSRHRADWWDRKFNPRNPAHWPYWLRSRRDVTVVVLERAS